MKESIYTLKLARRGIDIREGKEVNVLKSMHVKDVMSSQVETVSEDWPLERVSDKISKSKLRIIEHKTAYNSILSG